MTASHTLSLERFQNLPLKSNLLSVSSSISPLFVTCWILLGLLKSSAEMNSRTFFPLGLLSGELDLKINLLLGYL